jgi:hypothetical protein
MNVFFGLLKTIPFIFACCFLFFGAFMNGLIQQFVQRIADERIHTNLNQKLQILSQIKNITDNSNHKVQIVELSQDLFDLIRSNSSNETTVKKEVLFDSGFYILPFLDFKNVGRISDYYLWTVVRNQFKLKKAWIDNHSSDILWEIYFYCNSKNFLFSCNFVHFQIVDNHFDYCKLFYSLIKLPDPFPNCKPHLDPNVFVATILIIISVNNTCADLFFSGHSVALGMCLYVWIFYQKRFQHLLSIFYSLVAIAGWLIFIASRFHYTIDVVIGALSSIFIWKFYHLCIESPAFRGFLSFVDTSKDNWFVNWFEGRRRKSFLERLESISQTERKIIQNFQKENEIIINLERKSEVDWKEVLTDGQKF